MDLNKVMLIGRLTKNPDARATPGGVSVASFGIATNRTYKDASGQRQEKVEYHNIVAWGKLADICGQYLTKGRRVYIEGRLQTRDWTGQDGVRRYSTEVIAENMIILDAPSGAGRSDTRAPLDTTEQQPESPSGTSDDESIETIPF